MFTGNVTWSPRDWTTGSVDFARRAGQWWLREFLDLFPSGFADWLVDRGSKSLLLRGDDDCVVFQLLNERRTTLATARITCAAYTPEAIDAFLRAHGIERADVVMGIELPAERIFTRKLMLPAETQRTLEEVLRQDLAAKTPFRLDDIHHDYWVRRGGDRFHVTHWLVRRQLVAEAVEELGLRCGDLAFVEADSGGGDLRPRIGLQRPLSDHTRGLRLAFTFLTASACLLAVSAFGLKYHAQQKNLDALAVELNEARTKAQRVRAALDKLEAARAGILRLRAEKAGPGLLDVWEEMTRVLPVHTWLTELRLSTQPARNEQLLVVTGFSAAAATLVGLIDQSPLFRDASLTSSIAIDPVEKKERFAIEAHVTAPDPLKMAAR
jgi:general secretion pathway protein L